MWTEAHVAECANLSQKRRCFKLLFLVCKTHQACTRLPLVLTVLLICFMRSYSRANRFVRNLKENIFVFISPCSFDAFISADEAGTQQEVIGTSTQRLDHPLLPSLVLVHFAVKRLVHYDIATLQAGIIQEVTSATFSNGLIIAASARVTHALYYSIFAAYRAQRMRVHQLK